MGLKKTAEIKLIIEKEINEALTELVEFNAESYLDKLIEYEEIDTDEEG